jgi:hypothetical protein
MPFVGIGVGIGRQRFASGIFAAYAARVAADGGVTEGGECVDAVSALMQTASLLLVPSGYKSGVVYSEIPTNGDGDLTFTRASDATRVNSDGEIESVATGVPRLDYSQGSCPSLLLEPQRTNLALSSDDLTNATYWTVLATRFTSSTTTSILGANNAFIFTEAIALDSHNIFAASANRPTSTSGATYTISAYFKQGTRRYAGITVGSGGSGIHVFLDTTTWAITDAKRFGVNTNWVYLSSQIVLSPNSGGWYRLSVTFRTDAALTLIPSIFASNVSTSASSEPTYLGDGSTIICGQPQLELGAYPTSYIKTTTATVTRIADAASKTGISSLIGQTEGTLFAEVDMSNWESPDRVLAISDGTSTNRVIIIMNTVQRFRFLATVGGAGQLDFSSSSLSNGIHKVAVGYKENDFAFYIDGVEVGTDTSALVPACTDVYLGKVETAGSGQFFGNGIKQAALFPTRLTNSQLAQLTTL